MKSGECVTVLSLCKSGGSIYFTVTHFKENRSGQCLFWQIAFLFFFLQLSPSLFCTFIRVTGVVTVHRWNQCDVRLTATYTSRLTAAGGFALCMCEILLSDNCVALICMHCFAWRAIYPTAPLWLTVVKGRFRSNSGCLTRTALSVYSLSVLLCRAARSFRDKFHSVKCCSVWVRVKH